MTLADVATRIHREAVAVDGMNNASMSGEYLLTMIEAGISATMIPVSITAPFRRTIEQLSRLLKVLDEHADKALIVRNTDDVLRAKREGKVGLALVLEDTRQIEDDLDLLRIFWQLGIRRMQLVYGNQNSMCSGRSDRRDAGLTRLGAQAIERMEKLGILVDLSHCPPTSMAEALEVASKPVVLSHVNVRGVYNHPNNVPDEQLDMVARNGGVVGISGVPFYVAPGKPNIDQLVNHVVYVEKRIGIDHVGIGTAIFEGHPLSFYEQFNLPEELYGKPPWTWPEGIHSIKDFPSITTTLLARGYSEGAVRKILGENFMRVFQAAWA